MAAHNPITSRCLNQAALDVAAMPTVSIYRHTTESNIVKRGESNLVNHYSILSRLPAQVLVE